MNTRRYRIIFSLITLTILVTIGVQFYWNYTNYKINKQRIINDIQISFNNAIEEYYAIVAKKSFTTILKNNPEEQPLNAVFSKIKEEIQHSDAKYFFNTIKIDSNKKYSKKQIDSITKFTHQVFKTSNLKTYSIEVELDSSLNYTVFADSVNRNTFTNYTGAKYYKSKKTADSLRLLKNLKPVFIAFLSDKIDYNKIDTLLKNQLARKDLAIETTFLHKKLLDTLFYKANYLLDSLAFSITSNTTYLKSDETFTLKFNNPVKNTLKRSSAVILLSFLLSLIVIASLFYLLKIINDQKELAIVKNDLISNITHEFKTPIATVSAAIEAIEHFNIIEDKEKTKKYLSVSSVQLKKLHQGVEKLLETATLDSESLVLKKEMVNVIAMIEKLVIKHKLLVPIKTILFLENRQPIYIDIDAFHFENALSNLIDNAIKYGGNTIEINIKVTLKFIEILVIDDGKGIEKQQQEKIFDKFYRIPKGNTHNVKGFGIGLYYCKNIIEKHDGKISLTSTPKRTVFKIEIPNE